MSLSLSLSLSLSNINNIGKNTRGRIRESEEDFLGQIQKVLTIEGY